MFLVDKLYLLDEYNILNHYKYKQISLFFNDLENYFMIKAITLDISRSHGSNASITAPSIPGYKFIFWIAAITNGWVGNVYVDFPLETTEKIWSANYGNTDTSLGKVYCYALYVKEL